MEQPMNNGSQRASQNTGAPQEGISPQLNNMPDNDPGEEAAVYANLGINGEPDSRNPGSEEASDTILYTDNATARNATENVSNGIDPEMPEDELLLEEEQTLLNNTDVEKNPDLLREERENDDKDRYLAY